MVVSSMTTRCHSVLIGVVISSPLDPWIWSGILQAGPELGHVGESAVRSEPPQVFDPDPELVAFALSKNSPAVNAGNNALIPGAVTTDQRGFARVLATTVDIGAFEVDPVPPSDTINQAAAQTDPTISRLPHLVVLNQTLQPEDRGVAHAPGQMRSSITSGPCNLNQAIRGLDSFEGQRPVTIPA